MLGSAGIAAPAPALLFSLAAAWMLRRKLSRWGFVLAALSLLLTATRAELAVSGFEADLEGARARLGGPRRCAGTGVVVTSPVRVGGTLRYSADFDSLDCEGRELGVTRARLYGGPPDLGRGDRVEVVAQLASVELFRNDELPDRTPSAARGGAVLSGGALAVQVTARGLGPAWLIDRERARARDRIDATFPPDAAPLARALVLGENDLTASDDAAFRASGLSHLLAVSGTHLVFAILGIVHALGFVLARVEPWAARGDVRRAAAALGAVLAFVYADFAGGSGSAWRAAGMLGVALLARALGRKPDAGRAFALSLVLGAVTDPLVGFDVSFLLSVAATAGLLLLGRPIASRLAPASASRFRRALGASFAATLSATIPCAPVLATLGPELTLAGVFANVLAAPFGETVSLPLCLLHVVVPSELAARGIGLVAGGALLAVRWVAREAASVSWLAFAVPPPSRVHFALLGTAAAFAVLQRCRSWSGAGGASTPHSSPRVRWGFRAAVILAMTVVELRARGAGHPHGVLRVTVLDVGQGDAALIDLPDGTLVLVDGGGMVGSPVDPGRSVILPVLRARRRSRLDIVVLSHPHPDHFLGLVSTLAGIQVGELWDTGEGREHGAGPEYAAMIADLERRRIPIRGPRELCGPSRPLGGAEVHVLAPCPSWDPALGANDNSFVIRMEQEGRAVLLMGDAEHEAERRLVRAGVPLVAEFLKVGHHGSRTSSSTELLAAVRPRFATVSSGVRNRFGHPHPVALGNLEALGVTVLRTDLLGSITWTAGAVSHAGKSGEHRGPFPRSLDALW